MNVMSRLSVMIAWAGLTACATSGTNSPNSGPVNAPVQGAYAFTANLPEGQLRGRVQITGSEIRLEPTTGTCQAIDADSVGIRFACSGSGRYEHISIRIDRYKPAERSTWSASYQVQRTRQVCAEYGTVSGQQVCLRTHTEYYDATEGKRGKLSVRRAS